MPRPCSRPFTARCVLSPGPKSLGRSFIVAVQALGSVQTYASHYTPFHRPQCYVEHVVKDPLYEVGQPVTSPLFTAEVDARVRAARYF